MAGINDLNGAFGVAEIFNEDAQARDMEIAELERLADTLCMSLLNQDFSDIAQNIAYALQAERPLAVAIKEDYECARTESGGNLELANYSVVIKKFQAGTPGFIHLIECRFTLPQYTQRNTGGNH